MEWRKTRGTYIVIERLSISLMVLILNQVYITADDILLLHNMSVPYFQVVKASWEATQNWGPRHDGFKSGLSVLWTIAIIFVDDADLS